MPNWKKLITSGSSGSLANLTVDNHLSASLISGSFYGDGSGLTGVTAAGTLSSSAQIADDISGSFVQASSSIASDIDTLQSDSSSFSTRVTDLETFSSSLDATFATEAELKTATASLSSSLAADIATRALTANISGSFTSTSESIATDIATNLASITTLEGKTLVSGSAQIADNISGSLSNTAIAALGAGITSGSAQIVTLLDGQNLTLGEVSASKLHTTVVSSSILFTSGSNIIGDELTDTHQFTGSVTVTGSLSATTFSGTFTGVLSSSAQIADDISGSFVQASSSIATDIDTLQAASASHETSINTLESKTLLSSSAQIASDISGSITSTSSSIASDIASLVSFSSSLETTIYDYTGSFTGDGSGLTGVQSTVTEQVTVTDSFTSATTHSIAHTFGTKDLNVTVYDSNDDIFIPTRINTPNTESVVIYMDPATTGRAVISKGGHLVSGSIATDIVTSSTVSDTFTSATTHSVAHTFGTKDVFVSVYDSNDDVFIPTRISTPTTSSVVLYMDPATTGRVVIGKAGHIVSGSGVADFTNITSNPFTSGSGAITASGHLVPSSTEIYDLGSSNLRWKDLYLSGSTIDLGGTKITRDATTGDIEFKDAGDNRKSIKVDELTIGSGATARKIKVNNGRVQFTDTSDNVESSSLGTTIPSANNTYDLGSPTAQWRHLYLSTASLYMDGTKVLSSNADVLTFTTDVGQSIKLLETGADDIILQTDTGNIELKGTVEILSGKKITDSAGTKVLFGDSIGITGSIDLLGTVDGIDLQAFSSSVATSIANSTADYTELTNVPSGIISGAAQLPSGIVSGSSQITRLLPAGIVSGSSQITNLLPAGTVSGSSQVSITTATTQDGSDSSTKIATTAFVQGRISNIIGNAGAALDTLGELSASLADATGSIEALTTSIDGKLAKSSNLSDLSDASTARTNLGLGTAAITNSTAYATAAQGSNADTAYGWGNHASAGYLTSISTPSSGDWFGHYAFVANDGVMEIGKYIDFHNTDGSTSDYDLRLTADTNILYVGGTLSATTITETSALRFKENINEDLDSSIIDKLRPVSYDWKDSKEKDYGFIAEEVAELDEILVTKDAEGKISGIKYTKLIPFLVKKIQEQEKRIKQLENGNS